MVDSDDPPEFLVRLPRHLTAGGQDAHLVALPNLPAGQLDGFWHMPFEVQPERATVGKGSNLPLEILGKCGLSIP